MHLCSLRCEKILERYDQQCAHKTEGKRGTDDSKTLVGSHAHLGFHALQAKFRSSY